MAISQRFRYAVLGFPLAFLGLPLYLYLPKYFADTYGLSLASIGVVLLFLRVADMLVDPLIGFASDRHAGHRRGIMAAGGLLAVICYVALYWPALIALQPFILFTVLTGLLYIGYSTVTINYYAYGLTQAADATSRVTLSAAREGMVLVGTLAAALLPSLIQQAGYTMHVALQVTAGVYALSLVLGLLLLFRLPQGSTPLAVTSEFCFKDFVELLRRLPALRWLFALFFVNSLPVAITSTLFLFYVSDVLQQEQAAGYFLALYFATAALSTSFWSRAARRFGQHRALLVGMVVAVVSFSWTYTLNAETASYFYYICAMSGFALGADMVILPALLADALNKNHNFGGISFALWQALGKWSLALAAGVMLPLLALAGYQPSAVDTGVTETAVVALAYAVVPCALKIAAILLVLKHRRLQV